MLFIRVVLLSHNKAFFIIVYETKKWLILRTINDKFLLKVFYSNVKSTYSILKIFKAFALFVPLVLNYIHLITTKKLHHENLCDHSCDNWPYSRCFWWSWHSVSGSTIMWKSFRLRMYICCTRIYMGVINFQFETLTYSDQVQNYFADTIDTNITSRVSPFVKFRKNKKVVNFQNFKIFKNYRFLSKTTNPSKINVIEKFSVYVSLKKFKIFENLWLFYFEKFDKRA